MLPGIKITLPLIALLWCVFGVWAHGVRMLAYPAMWLAVAAVFYALHLATRTDDAGDMTSGDTASQVS